MEKVCQNLQESNKTTCPVMLHFDLSCNLNTKKVTHNLGLYKNFGCLSRG